jgi:hypothetical protein
MERIAQAEDDFWTGFLAAIGRALESWRDCEKSARFSGEPLSAVSKRAGAPTYPPLASRSA